MRVFNCKHFACDECTRNLFRFSATGDYQAICHICRTEIIEDEVTVGLYGIAQSGN